MHFKLDTIGREIGPARTTATARRILAFAAVIDSDDPGPLDDLSADGLIAIPSFCAALEWRLLSAADRSVGLAVIGGDLSRYLHVGQDSLFHAPIRAGAELQVAARVVGLSSVRAGALLTLRIETRDAVVGTPLVTSWCTVLCRGATIEGPDRLIDAADSLIVPNAPSRHRVEIPIARGLPHLYAECAGIINPIHTERRAARDAGLPDIVLQGTATWAIAGRELARRLGRPAGRRLHRLAGDFRAPVIPGSIVTLFHDLVEDPASVVGFEVRDQHGAIAIANGRAAFTR